MIYDEDTSRDESKGEKMSDMVSELRLPALEIRQGENRRLYSFAVDGKKLHSFAAVSRMKRGDEQEIKGYQRPEVLSHIREIKNYIESTDAMIPNALVVAFDDRVRFEPLGKASSDGSYSRHGEIVIPLDSIGDDADKPGWIVDGQQRAAAMRDAAVKQFPICVTAFITGDEQEQREQFILVNSVKPLPRSLIYELLPSTEAKLASHLQKRRFPAKLLERLNFDEDSPFYLLIQTPTTPTEKRDGVHFGVIKDNSLLKMIENSLTQGVLYRYRDPSTGQGDLEAMLAVLKTYWWAVRDVFPDAWGLPSRKSRLMHGTGILSMGFMMDAIADRHRSEGVLSRARYVEELGKVAPHAKWTNGFWDFGGGVVKKWSDLQNMGKDIMLVSNFLLGNYLREVRAA